MTSRVVAGWGIVHGVDVAVGRNGDRQPATESRLLEISRPNDLGDIANLGQTLSEAKQLLAVRSASGCCFASTRAT